MVPPDGPVGQGQDQTGTKVQERTRTQPPPRFKVLLHNDDFTTMEFVVNVLVRFFGKDPTEATQIMLMVHFTGIGVAGTYTREIAETKVSDVSAHSRENQMPLRCSMEPE